MGNSRHAHIPFTCSSIAPDMQLGHKSLDIRSFASTGVIATLKNSVVDKSEAAALLTAFFILISFLLSNVEQVDPRSLDNTSL